ncbi:DUF3923 family protein [Companilactobacillus heilongjiangensis]|uniref:NADH:ubiquinone oxidoreductase n=1 Tax=Companilactobacillus heilongjiangensis TaxID=1074467 RepID=A0A0K2LAZ2_9LACO|nr:DUF3923 family protein [Companilactobacillus heilongjiangensis]ALB28461.1 hypothetical protein JP39_03275 [Companilactobacillus heilongjiangensis]
MKVWHGINLMWFVLFAMGAIFILMRKVDGAGAVQTPKVKTLSLLVLGAFYIFIWLCQLITLRFIRRHK